MKTIKFRIWNGKDGYCTEEFVKANLFNIIDSRPEYVQQFTGLLDKFGKEIYEGDIVDYKTESPVSDIDLSYKGRQVVEFCEETTGFGLNIADENEIVGNIYENPELLK